MKTTAMALALAAAPPSSALFPRAVGGQGFLSIPVGAISNTQGGITGMKQVADSLDVALDNRDYFYSIEVGLGTPPQSVTVLVDTGSSELWVNPDCSTARTKALVQQCAAFGRYDATKSKTPPVGPFGGEELRYGDPSDAATLTSVTVRYYLDAVSLGGAQIRNQTFGVVQSSKGQAQGILGLAPDVHGGFNGTQPYSLLLNSMAEQGVINSRAFSLDLRHADAAAGAVVYGGIDRSRFTGALAKQALVRGDQGEYRLAVNLDSMGITAQGTSASFKLGAQSSSFLLDSGTSLSRVNPAVAAPILQALNAQQDGGSGYFYVSCALRNQSGSTVDFGFGGTVVSVPLSDFVIDDPSGPHADYCLVGLAMTTDQQILGDSVLRAGYFVFDWDNEEVHIAQAADCGAQDIIAIGTGPGAVPAVQGNCKEGDVPTATPSVTSGGMEQASGNSGAKGAKSAGAREEAALVWIGTSAIAAAAVVMWLG